MKLTHTHRGHCQLCGRVQALDPNTGLIAKHGYNVEFGYFQGTCPGSDNVNLHVERTLADKSIWQAREKAVRLEALADDYEARVDNPRFVRNGEIRLCKPWGQPKERPSYDWRPSAPYIELREEDVTVPWDEAPPEWQEKGRASAIVSMRSEAQNALNYADDLERFANLITQKVAPFAVADLRLKGFAVGDVVRVGGKKNGVNLTIEAIEDREYRTFGFRRGRSTSSIPHARFTFPARPATYYSNGLIKDKEQPERTHWEPLRFLKKPPADSEA